MSGVEILRTERLILRHLTDDDAPFILEHLNERGFIENIGDRGVRDLNGACEYIHRVGGSYQRYGYGLWGVVLKTTGQVIGLCGLIRRDGMAHTEIGYSFLESAWGQGFAFEAASAALRHAREVIGLETVVAITSPTNAGSIAVLLKIGLRPAGTIHVPGFDGESAYFTLPAALPPSARNS